MHLVLVNCLGGLTLPRNSVCRLIDHHYMTEILFCYDVKLNEPWHDKTNKSIASTTWYPHCAYFCCLTCFGIKNINVSTRFDQSHQLFHKILSINIILKSIKGHNSVEKFGKIMCISHSMDHIISVHKQNFIKIHSLFLKILRKIEIRTSVKGHNSVEKFGKI